MTAIAESKQSRENHALNNTMRIAYLYLSECSRSSPHFFRTHTFIFMHLLPTFPAVAPANLCQFCS